jgi:hypothetical protein
MTRPLMTRVPAELAALLDDAELAAELATLYTPALREWEVGKTGRYWSEHLIHVVLDRLRHKLVTEAAPPGQRLPGIRLVESERLRQLDAKRYDAAHDDQLCHGELLDMACWFVSGDSSALEWPWEDDAPEHLSRVDDLIRAAALICAEIDRRLRAGERPTIVDGEVVAILTGGP